MTPDLEALAEKVFSVENTTAAMEKWPRDGTALTYGQQVMSFVNEALTALGHTIAPPDHVAVPREPTKEMVEAGAAEMDPTWGYSIEDIANSWAAKGYRAMLAAAQGGQS